MTRHKGPFAIVRFIGVTPDHSRKASARSRDRFVATIGRRMLIRTFRQLAENSVHIGHGGEIFLHEGRPFPPEGRAICDSHEETARGFEMSTADVPADRSFHARPPRNI